MKLSRKIALLQELGDYLVSESPEWLRAQSQASQENPWFLPSFIRISAHNLREQMLQPESLANWARQYDVPESLEKPKTVGLVMAGNIPLVGFHDFLSVFISGHHQAIKTSSKDDVLIRHIVDWLTAQEPSLANEIKIQPMLKNCDAYIATGSDNSARYFEQYFQKYPHIIRRNRTSVAMLDGTETEAELDALADDIQLFFGLGCRNVTQLLVPEGYDFVPLLEALKKYDYFLDQHKYKHNFDYNLTIQIMNNQYYMTNGSILLSENSSPFSPIGVVNYQFFRESDKLSAVSDPEKIQCIVGHGYLPFGQVQKPRLFNYADGVDTMEFLKYL
jgi:hypothetical protein